MQITVRDVDSELASKLKERAAAQGKSVNALVLEILRNATDSNPRRKHLARYTTWTSKDAAHFDAALRAQRVVDDNLWK